MMRTPREISPYRFFQERYRDEPWRLLVVVIMLNQTNGKQVERVHERFFEWWPTPEALWDAPVTQAGADEIIAEMADVLRPLGLQNRRALRIWRMTFDYLIVRPDPCSDVTSLHGCGRYAQDSWDIFVRGELPTLDAVDDKELRRYVEWATEEGMCLKSS